LLRRVEKKLRHPYALIILAEMIVTSQTPGLPSEALALLETVPRDERRRTLNAHLEYVLCLTHMALAACHDQDSLGAHARAAFNHANRALGLGFSHALQQIAFCLEEGFGTEVNLDQAFPMLLMGCKMNFELSTARVREIIAEDPPTLITLRFIQSTLTMRAMGQLTDDDMSRNPTLAACWALTEEFPPPPDLAAQIAVDAANVQAEDPEETFAALGMDPPPPTGQDGEA